jgi:hypothetical protein
VICPVCGNDHVTEREAKRIKAYDGGQFVDPEDDDEDGATVYGDPDDMFETNEGAITVAQLVVPCDHACGTEPDDTGDGHRCCDCWRTADALDEPGLKPGALVCLFDAWAKWDAEQSEEDGVPS